MKKHPFITPQNAGRALENMIHKKISLLGECTSTDSKIIKKYNCRYGLDHVLIINNKYLITIQDKWEKKGPNDTYVDHFVGPTKDIIKRHQYYEPLLALFISKEEMTREGKKAMDNANNENYCDLYYAIDNSMSLQSLTKAVYEFICEHLKTKGINISVDKKQKITLWTHQQEAIDCFENNFLKKNIKKNAIVCHPTGSGKTITSLSMVGTFWKYNPKLSILWITNRKDILHSQFDSSMKFDVCINSGLINDYSDFNLILWYNKEGNFDSLNQKLKKKSQKPMFLITNTDCIKYDQRYKLIDKNQFGLVIVDECHASGADGVYSMLSFFQKKWDNLQHIVGFSATPIRPDLNKFKKTVKIFGDGTYVYFIHRLSFMDAIDKGLIVLPEFYWIETKTNLNVSYKNFNIGLDKDDYYQVIKHIETLLIKSITNKCIMWTKTIKDADEWFKIITDCQQTNTYPELKKYKLLISHTGDSCKYDGIHIFQRMNHHAMLICVGRCQEGFDDPKVDVVVALDAVENRTTIKFIQRSGRSLRKYGKKTHGLIMESFTINSEEDKVRQICETIIGYSLLLEDIDKKSKNYDPEKTYEKCSKRFKCDAKNKQLIYTTPQNKRIAFNIVSTTLKSFDWNNLPKKLKESIQKSCYTNGIGYEHVKKIIKEHDHRPHNKEEYLKLCKIDHRLPEDPDIVFNGQFMGWIDYLSLNDRKYYDLETCKKQVQQYLIDFPEMIDDTFVIPDYHKICVELCNMDRNFPPSGLWVDHYNREDTSIGEIEDIINIPEFDDGDLDWFNEN